MQKGQTSLYNTFNAFVLLRPTPLYEVHLAILPGSGSCRIVAEQAFLWLKWSTLASAYPECRTRVRTAPRSNFQGFTYSMHVRCKLDKREFFAHLSITSRPPGQRNANRGR